jgi:hypothetical protein
MESRNICLGLYINGFSSFKSFVAFFFIECKNIIDKKYAGDQQYKKREQNPLNKT